MAFSREKIQASLTAAKLKCTKPREIVLGYLSENHGPFSAKEIHAALKRKDLDSVTVYRCLSAFEESGLVRRSDFGDGIARYEFGHDHHHHHHIRCTKCLKIQELESCALSKLENQLREMGYSKIRHMLEFSGLCQACT